MLKSFKTILVITSLLALLFISLWGLGDALFPLMISFALAYLLFPLIRRIESTSIPRNYAVITVFSIGIIFSCLIFVLVVPGMIKDGTDLAKNIPQITIKAFDKMEKMSADLGFDIDISNEEVKNYIEENISQLSKGVIKSLSKAVKGAFSGLAKWIVAILNIFLIPLFFFYVVNDFEKISAEIKSFIPRPMQKKVLHTIALSNEVISGYIRGQLMVALVLAALYSIGLSLIGLKFGFLIGIVSGLISIIPYAGFSIGFTTALLIGLANYSGVGQLISIFSVFAIVQTLESFIITPKLVGNKVGLSSLETMLALIIGGNLLGLSGMLIGIPIAAILKSNLSDLKKEYLQLEFNQ